MNIQPEPGKQHFHKKNESVMIARPAGENQRGTVRACLHGCGEPEVGEVTCLGGVKNISPLHAILQPRHPGVQSLKIIEWSLSTTTKKKCWQTTCFGDQCTSSLTCCSCCNLQCNSFLLLTLIMMQSHRQNEFCANLMYHKSDPGQVGYPTLKRLHGKI